ncbi:MAG: cytochrome C biogenesis protein [Cyanobacteria bacterium J083]|nr:MAG: cytochrome C biogenesis protein [Cyanobacteria bacterium J083]
MLNSLIRFIGSIKLAIPLLTAIIGILIWATFYETQVGSTTVQQAVYKSPWFGALMLLLAVNLAVSALSRYPWRGGRKIGFALTHFGLIVIIAGSAGVIHLGMEGMLLVRTDGGANNRIRVEGDLLEIINPQGEREQTNIFVKPDNSVRPKNFGGLELLSYTDKGVINRDFIEQGTTKNPGVKLSLQSDRMGGTTNRSLALLPEMYSKVYLGPAELEIIQVQNQAELKQLLEPQVQGNHPWGKIEIITKNETKTLDVQQNKGKTEEIGQIKIQIAQFFPDFRLDQNNSPVTASEKLNNPALTLNISSPQGKERWYLFAKADFPPIRRLISGNALSNLNLKYRVQPAEADAYFKVIVDNNNQLYYAAKSSQQFKSGTLAIGEPITPGWADFKITLQEYLPHAQLQTQVIATADKQTQGTPALLVKSPTGIETWLPWGEATTIPTGDKEVYAAFSPKLFQLPFAIKLEDFIVDRNEGSDSVAMWTSKIRIKDTQNNITQQRQVWMNHPTWYKGWKIAQASWNPGDLKQSTLQVKREPAWITALTWSGSGMVILGIAVMFYAPVLAKKMRKLPQNSDIAEQAQELVTS